MKYLRIAAVVVLVLAGLAAAVVLKGLRDASVDPPARRPSASRFLPTEASLATHRLPRWFADAKFGILIHWGLYSVPGFAPNGRFADVLRTDYSRAMLVHPYAEDYANAIKDPSTPSAAFHRAHYGTMPYDGFQPIFERNLARWDPDAWAQIFRDAGAEYVVLVAKYHDGYALWPSVVRNPHAPSWVSRRDLVGDLAAAVRRHGMRFGVYYSGGVDWTFRPDVVRTLGDYAGSTPGGGYPAYADAQVRELVERYRPDILWNDISWPTDRPSLFRLFADYYDTVPQGVVNDRWSEVTPGSVLMRLKPARMLLDLAIATAARQDPDFASKVQPPPVPHSDYTTPEYTQYAETQAKKWEMTRGMGNSFGYNRAERDADYASAETLLTSLVDATSKNGNLLLNVGPRGEDMQIPEEQKRRLAAIGAWLGTYGGAIRGTRPWSRSSCTTASGDAVRFTARDRTVYATVLGHPIGATLVLKGVSLDGEGRRVDDGTTVRVTSEGGDTRLDFERPLEGAFAPAVRIEPKG